ncbi:MAG TPA: hypothetical protein PKW60_08565, partial [Candidatus Hydrogenedentes bacterium]|nr:hypothetical protein [Candidatus Hydrogenedentota bacterium]
MEAFWDRIDELALDKSGTSKLVPVEDADLFRTLAVEAARFCEVHGASGAIVLADAQTAGQVSQLAAIIQEAALAVCAGPRPDIWKKAGNVVQVKLAGLLRDHRFLIVVTPSFSLALIGVQTGG